MSTDRLLMGAIAVLFCMVLIILVFTVCCCGIWLRNRREERNARDRQAARRLSSRYSKCWTEWAQIVDGKDEEIEKLRGQISQLTQSLERTKKLLSESEKKRLETAV